MKSALLIVTLLLSTSSCLFAQRIGAMWWYANPHQAEAIRLGGAYTAVGRGLTSMHNNTAALGFQEGAQVLLSSGRSLNFEDAEFSSPYSMAAAMHIPGWQTTVGLSFDDDKWILERSDETGTSNATHDQNNRLGIHLARRLNNWLSLGLAVRRHESTMAPAYTAREQWSWSAVGWDLSMSAHGRHTASFIGRSSDEIRYGLSIDNMLGTEVWYIDEAQKDPLHQVFRVGAAYFWNPDMGSVLNANILSALLTVESSLQGTKYEFRNWGTMGGAAELRILEVLMLSAGIENIVQLDNEYDYWPEYPVLRYGAGIDLPLDRIFGMDIPFALQIDYAHTAWNSDAEEELFWNPGDHPQQVNAFSLQLRADVF